nr:DUF2213 domain-containing protein [Pantoea cypripedii]
MKLLSIHVKSLAINASNISTTTIDGAEHYVIRGVVPIVDDIVMNGGLYPAEEINNSYQSMEGKLMPLSHPKVDGNYVSANDPRAVNKYHAGAWAQNVSKAGDKVVMDVYVNKAVAESKPDGKRLIERLDGMVANTNTDPIHVSTGLLTNKETKAGESKGKKHSWIARNMRFDHVAILLDEPGAGTPADGVGMFVNADGEQADVEAVNLADSDTTVMPASQDPSLKSFFNQLKAFFSANSNPVKEEANPMKELITNALKAKGIDVEGKSDAELMDAYNQMAVNDAAAKTAAEEKAKKEKQAADKAKQQQAINNDQAPAWFAPFAEKLNSIESGLTANVDKDKAVKRAAVKAKFGLDDVAVNAMDGAALDGMYEKCQTSHGLNGAFSLNSQTDDQWKDYDLNAGMEQEKK